MKPRNGFLLLVSMGIFIIGCEKKATPFSADPVTQPQGSVSMYVYDGFNLAPNVTIKGIDPSGNIFDRSSDSNGVAIFSPIPFTAGDWTFQIPNQNHRCFGPNSQSITLSTGVNSESATFEYGVATTLTTGFPTSGGSGQVFTGNVNFATQNDCGITWTCSISLSSPIGSVWHIGNSSALSSGNTYSFNLISGQSEPWTIVLGLAIGSISSSINLSSIFGSTNSISGLINNHF